jgi:hypothetical protein
LTNPFTDWDRAVFLARDQRATVYCGVVVAVSALHRGVELAISFTPALAPEATLLDVSLAAAAVNWSARVSWASAAESSTADVPQAHLSSSARHALELARRAAVAMQQTAGAEHVLLGVAEAESDVDGVVRRVLDTVNMLPATVRSAIESVSEELDGSQGEVLATLRAAEEHASRLGSIDVESHHLLIGAWEAGGSRVDQPPRLRLRSATHRASMPNAGSPKTSHRSLARHRKRRGRNRVHERPRALGVWRMPLCCLGFGHRTNTSPACGRRRITPCSNERL